MIGTGATRFETFFGPTEAKKPNVLTLHVTAVGRNGLPVKVVDMNAELANPSKDVPAITAPDQEVPGRDRVTTSPRASACPSGRWVLTIKRLSHRSSTS